MQQLKTSTVQQDQCRKCHSRKHNVKYEMAKKWSALTKSAYLGKHNTVGSVRHQN